MTVTISLDRISASEFRVTLIGEIRIRSNLGPLIFAQCDPAWAEGTGREAPGGARWQEFLTVEQTAEILHVSRDAVYAMIRRRQLRSIKIGRLRRISRQWISEFAEHHR